ncbi:MAG: hypothetical protein R3290_10330 [Acidimicrobiia bacterium]|nr:hypothetical protein [Acidimicrobiia bacterium]
MSDFFDTFTAELKQLGSDAAEWGVKILVALVVLIVGRWIIKIVRNWIEKALDTDAVKTVFEKSGVTQALAPSGRSAAALVGTIAYAAMMLVLFLIVARILDVPEITSLLERLIAVLPLIIVAVVLVIIASAVASFVADLVAPFAERRNIGWLTTAVRVFILLFGVLAAMDLLDIRFAEDLVKIVTAAAGIAFAVAFGVGGIDTAKEWWARYARPRA